MTGTRDEEARRSATSGPPIPEDEERRLEALLSYEVLDTEAEQAFDDLTRLAASICGAPIALISLVDERRQWFKSRVGLECSETPRELAFCAYSIHAGETLIVPDASLDERFSTNPLVTGSPGIRFYAGAPLGTPGGARIGTLCVIDDQPRTLTDEQLGSLEALARQVVSQLELRKAVRELQLAEREMRSLRDRAEENAREIGALNDELERANEEKSSFLATMSHELRTPMTAVLGYAEECKENISEEARNEALATIIGSGHYLLSLINDVLDLSKIEAGELNPERRPFSPAQATREVCELLAPLAQKKQLELVDFSTPDAPEVIEGDRLRFRQVLTNIVGNAIKFTARGSILITLSRDDARDRLNVAVADSGIGMTATQTSRIFEAFTQADESTTREFGGTGLGLSLSRELVKAMGGELGVWSRPSEGSVFRFDLPIGRPEASTDLAAAIDGARATPIRSQFPEGIEILLAEDNRVNQRLIRRVLERLGASVTTASNGQEAVDAVAERDFDVVLLDMQMPVLDGLSAARAIRESGCKVPIIALTANALSSDREKCLQAGCDQYATKPIDRGQLFAQITDLVERHESA